MKIWSSRKCRHHEETKSTKKNRKFPSCSSLLRGLFFSKARLAVGALWLVLTGAAAAQVGEVRVEITPAAPAATDNISIKLSGVWNDSCVPREPVVTVADNLIRIRTVHPGGACLAVLTPFTLQVNIGRLPVGVYIVVATHSFPSPNEPRDYAKARFTVGGIGENAYSLVAGRAMAHRRAFYVYQDADSGFNHGAPSGFYGAAGKVRLDAGCVNDLSAATGCAPPGSTQLDRERGTALRVTFDPLAQGEFAGVNFEEPENWGARGMPASRGYDLRGATELVFEVRSPAGIRVQFGVGGRVTDFLNIERGAAFTTLRIRLDSLKDPATGAVSPPDLGDVHFPFAVAANSQFSSGGGQGGTLLLLDNIRFEPTPASRQSALGFPLANQTFGITPFDDKVRGRVPIPPDQLLRNVTTTYESALALLALLHRGTAEDRAAARAIADALVYALSHDNSGAPLPVAGDRSTGLRNAYASGDLALLNDQGQGAGKAGEVRLAGFSARELCKPTGFCLVLDGATGGNNAFVILALAAASVRLDKPEYLAAAETIGRWIVDRLSDRGGTGYGGYFNGYDDGGVAAPKPVNKGKSVENNADIFAAFSTLALLAKQQGRAADAAAWTLRAGVAGDFVIEMFDASGGRFYAGTVPAGTQAGNGICLSTMRRGDDVINTCDFLDANSFPALALAVSPRYRSRIDWRRPVQFLVENFSQTVTSDGKEFRGFNLVKTPGAGPNGIAWEFTAQAVVAMRLADGLYGETRFKATADAYVERLRQAQSQDPFGDGVGLVAATLQNGHQLPPLEQCLSTPFQCIPQRVGLAATAWAVFAERGINPFAWLWPASSVSAASYSGAALAPESIAAAFGGNLATTTAVAASIPLPTSLGGSALKLRDSANIERIAPLFFVSPAQVNFLTPPMAAAGEAVVTATSGDGAVSISPATIAPVAPGLFSADASGRGIAAGVVLRVKSDGSQVYEAVSRFDPAMNRIVAVPIDLGPEGGQVFLILFGTGLRFRSALSAVTATIGGVASDVLFAAEQGALAGVDQINLRLARTLAGRGEVDVVLSVDGVIANVVRVSFK
ncbi:MAG: hypothetical protein ACREEM_41335 [Blastocatellia bacterium]